MTDLPVKRTLNIKKTSLRLLQCKLVNYDPNDDEKKGKQITEIKNEAKRFPTRAKK